MNTALFFAALSTLMPSCSGADYGAARKEEAPEILLKKNLEDTMAICLENELKYLKKPPNDPKDFAIKIGEASLKCQASKNDIVNYVKVIMAVHRIEI